MKERQEEINQGRKEKYRKNIDRKNITKNEGK